MLEHGVPKDKAENIVKKMKDRIKVKSHAHIYTDVVSTARILGMPLVNIHQPCDEYMRRRILDKIKTGYNDLVLDIVKKIKLGGGLLLLLQELMEDFQLLKHILNMEFQQ